MCARQPDCQSRSSSPSVPTCWQPSTVTTAPEATESAETTGGAAGTTDGGEATTDAAAASSAALTTGDTELPAPVPYVDPLIHSDNLAAIPVSITAEGDTAALFEFLRLVQTGKRLVSVSTVSVADATETEPARLDTSGYLYALHGQAVPQGE